MIEKHVYFLTVVLNMQALKFSNHIYIYQNTFGCCKPKVLLQSFQWFHLLLKLLETSNSVLSFTSESTFEFNVLCRYMYTLCTYSLYLRSRYIAIVRASLVSLQPIRGAVLLPQPKPQKTK